MVAKRRLNFGTPKRVKRRRRAKTPAKKYGQGTAPRMQVGFTPGRGAAKTATTSSSDEYTNITTVTYATDTLYSSILTTLSKGTAINQRERDIIHCLGLKLNLIVSSLQDQAALCFHYAFVAPKGGTTAVAASDFFRGYNDDRGRDFTANTLSGLDVLKNPINADKYTIFKHKRIWLHPQGGPSTTGIFGYVNSNTSGIRVKDEYLRIKRQLRYGDADNCETPIYLVWWAGFPQKAKADPASADAFIMTFRNVMVFNEPKT